MVVRRGDVIADDFQRPDDDIPVAVILLELDSSGQT